jgi:hypothetical protein
MVATIRIEITAVQELAIEFMPAEDTMLVVTILTLDLETTSTLLDTTIDLIAIHHTDTLQDVQLLDMLTEDTIELATTLTG